MQELPRLASRPVTLAGQSRLHWRVFARSLAAFAGMVPIAALGLWLARLQISSAEAAVAMGLVAGVGGSAVAVLVWNRRTERAWRRGMEAGLATANREESDLRGAEQATAADAAVWEETVKTLQEQCSEKQQEARQHYETLTELMRMVAKAVDERAAYLRGHSERVAQYAEAIARSMQIEEQQVERIRLAALLHDVGSLGVEDYLVLKETPLTPVEFDIVKAHTVKGAAILRPIAMLGDLIPGVELHHESLDGTGYPFGLKGDEIPMMARIVAVADSFDAMTTPRPYQAAMNSDYVLEVLERLSGTRYDRTIVQALTELVQSGQIIVRDVRVPVSFRTRKPVAELV